MPILLPQGGSIRITETGRFRLVLKVHSGEIVNSLKYASASFSIIKAPEQV